MTTLPPNYLRLSSTWLETNPLPEDAHGRTNTTPSGGWFESAWRGKMLPWWAVEESTYATARTDLPREAYADGEIRPMTTEEHKALDEFTMKELTDSEPGAEVASERAEAFAIHSIDGGMSESFEYVTVDDARRLESTITTLRAEIAELKAQVERKSDAALGYAQENTTLRAQLEAKDAELAMLQREMAGAIDNEQERWQDMLDRVFPMHVQNANIDGGGCESGDPLEFSESELHQAFQHLESQNDKLRAEVDDLRAAWEEIFASRKINGMSYRESAMALTAELDAVRKERDDWKESSIRNLKERAKLSIQLTDHIPAVEQIAAANRRADAAQARCGELERGLCNLDTAIADTFWISDDGNTQRPGTPEDGDVGEKLEKAWAEARKLLTPSQQPDNFDSRIADQGPLSESQPVRPSEKADLDAESNTDKTADSSRCAEWQPPAVNPSRPEPVIAGDHKCRDHAEDIGECSEGCCDKYRCKICGRRWFVEVAQ